jgi:hypothetical protein
MNNDFFSWISVSIRVDPRKSVSNAFLFLCLFFLGAGTAFAAEGDPQSIPPLKGHVNDLTGTLTAEQQQSLEADLTALEQRKGSQLAVRHPRRGRMAARPQERR